MTSDSYRRLIYAIATAMTSGFAGCRNPSRDLPDAPNAATLLVQLQNLESSDKNQKGYLYILNACVPDVSGSLTDSGQASFTAAGLKNNLSGCGLRIRTAQALAGAKFASGADPLELYSAQVSTIYLDLNGALAANAALNRLYSTGNEPLKTPPSPSSAPGTPSATVTIKPVQAN